MVLSPLLRTSVSDYCSPTTLVNADADFTEMGMKGIEIKRIRRKTEEHGLGGGMVIPDYSADAKAEPMVVQASPPQAMQQQPQQQPQMAGGMLQVGMQQTLTISQGAAPGVPLITNDGAIFGCFDDCEVCLCGTFCYCFLAGQNHARVGLAPSWQIPAAFFGAMAINACTGVLGLPLTLAYYYWVCKGRAATQMVLGQPVTDDCGNCMCCCCCHACVICQEARAVNAAWMANGMQPLTMTPGYTRMPGQMQQPGMIMQQQPGMMQQQPQMMQQPGMMQQQPGMMQQPQMQQPQMQQSYGVTDMQR